VSVNRVAHPCDLARRLALHLVPAPRTRPRLVPGEVVATLDAQPALAMATAFYSRGDEHESDPCAHHEHHGEPQPDNQKNGVQLGRSVTGFCFVVRQPQSPQVNEVVLGYLSNPWLYGDRLPGLNENLPVLYGAPEAYLSSGLKSRIHTVGKLTAACCRRQNRGEDQ